MATLRYSINAAGCWIWLGPINDQGYGMDGHSRAHRAIYEEMVGPIPDGLVLDHLCSVRNCVNPEHLEPVTQAENARRGALGRDRSRSRCKNGHDFVSGSFSLMRGGTNREYMVKRWLICHRDRERRRRAA